MISLPRQQKISRPQKRPQCFIIYVMGAGWWFNFSVCWYRIIALM